jgi:hypothetical protein
MIPASTMPNTKITFHLWKCSIDGFETPDQANR